MNKDKSPAPPAATAPQGEAFAVEYLRERTRTCNTEASASMKRCSGDMTQYAENLIREGEIAWRYADEIEKRLAASARSQQAGGGE